MNTREMAEEYLKKADRYFNEAINAHSEEDFSTAIRRCQESVELAIKAVLRLCGIEYPRKHDVSDLLDKLSDLQDIPDYFKESIPTLKQTMQRLSQLRGPAMYGDEANLTPPSRLFSEQDAEKNINDTRKTLQLCKKLFREWIQQQ